MPRTLDLPPPPLHPEVSPPARVAGEEPVTFDGLEGEPSLSGLVRGSADASRVVVLCHPHPLYGGTMHTPVILALARALEARPEGVATLRFDYRGVGASQGEYGHGLGETRDVQAAIRLVRVRFPRAAVVVAGYSFGTWVGLKAAATEGGIDRVALIAPAVRAFDFVREDAVALTGRLAIYLGDDDEFCDVSEARELAAVLGAPLTILPGNDHSFRAGRRKLAELVTPFLVAER